MTDVQADPNEKWVDEPPEAESIAPDEITTPAAAEPGTAVERHAEGNAALAAAETAALAMPGVPGRDEFLALAMQARMLSMSGAAPKAIRNNPYVAFHIAMVGRDLGISPSAAMELIDVIETQGGPRISLSPQLLNGQIRRLGLGSIVPLVQARDRCVAQALDPNGQVIGETEFTWDDARDAGLVGPRCLPGEHQKERRQKRNGQGTYETCGCNQGYVTYPRRMMWWRAAGFCADDYFPEAGLGLYSPEELGAVVDAEGRPLDVASVALPPGYDDPVEEEQAKEARREEAQAKAEAPADEADLRELADRIARLPEGIRARLRDAWMGEDSNVRGYGLAVDGSLPVLPARKLRIARGLVNAWEGTARKEGWDPDAPPQASEDAEAPAQEAQEAPEPEAGPGVPAGASEAQDDERGPQSGDASAPPESADGEEPPYERKDGAPEPDWTPIAAALGKRVERACVGVPDGVIKRIVEQVKAMAWQKINAELDEAGVPTDGPIDLRRMHVSLLRLRAFRASQGMDDVKADGQPENPVLAPRGETPF
jgi:hypothetical protein